MPLLLPKINRRALGAELLINLESHYVGEDEPNWIFLAEAPLASYGLTIAGTPAGGGVFTATTSAPAAGEYRVVWLGRQMAGLEFNAADADIPVDITYKGRGSVVLARDLNRLHDQVEVRIDVRSYMKPLDDSATTGLERAIIAARSEGPGTELYWRPYASYRYDGPVEIGDMPLSFNIAAGAELMRDKDLLWILHGADLDGLVFDGHGKFVTDPLTPDFQQTNHFIYLERCDDTYVGPLEFNSLNAAGMPTMFSQIDHKYGNRVTQIGTRHIGSHGNCTGAQGDGAGGGGEDCQFIGLQVRDFVDTGIGLWTGAKRPRLISCDIEAFPVASGESAYTRVGVDCAGVEDPLILGGTIRRCTKGVRVLTNLTYTNTRVRMRDVLFQLQEGTSAEPAACVQINRSDTQDMQVSMKRCTLDVVTYGLIGYSTGASGVLRVEFDDNDVAGGNGATGMSIQGAGGVGLAEMVPGLNRFRMTGTGVAFASMGAAMASLSIAGEVAHTAFRASPPAGSVAFNNASTLNVVWAGRLTAGYYKVVLECGTMIDAGGVGANASVLGQANSFEDWMHNLDVEYLVSINTAGDYTIEYTSHPTGNNYTFSGLRIERVA